MGLPLSFGSFHLTNILLLVTSSTSGLSGASGGAKKIKKKEKNAILASMISYPDLKFNFMYVVRHYGLVD